MLQLIRVFVYPNGSTPLITRFHPLAAGNSARVDALYYGQGLGGVIFDSQNRRDAEGNTLLAAVADGTSPLSLVRAILKWGVDINAVNCRCMLRSRLKSSSRRQALLGPLPTAVGNLINGFSRRASMPMITSSKHPGVSRRFDLTANFMG